MKNIEKKAHQEALAEFRKKHLEELEINLTVAKALRDNTGALAKDRMTAIKEINLMLGTRSPEKTTSAITKQAEKDKNPFTKDEEKEIGERVYDIIGKI